MTSLSLKICPLCHKESLALNIACLPLTTYSCYNVCYETLPHYSVVVENTQSRQAIVIQHPTEPHKAYLIINTNNMSLVYDENGKLLLTLPLLPLQTIKTWSQKIKTLLPFS